MRRIRKVQLISETEARQEGLALAVMSRACEGPLRKLFEGWGTAKTEARKSARQILEVWAEKLIPEMTKKDTGETALEAPPDERLLTELGWTAEDDSKLRSALEMASLEKALAALAEARARAAYRSDTFAHLFRVCKLPIAMLLKPDRELPRDAERDKAVVECIRGVVALANIIVRKALLEGKALTELDVREVALQVRKVPAAPRGARAGIVGAVSVDVMRSVLDQAMREPDRIAMLPWGEANEGLVPFTSECQPEPFRANRCWCGCWVEVGVWQCPFCGEASPPPGARSTLLWRLQGCAVLQLSALPPAAQNAFNAAGIARVWRALLGDADPGEGSAENAGDEISGGNADAED